YWPIVVACSLIAGLVAGGYAALNRPPYEARALVAVTKFRSQVTLEPKFKTVTDDDLSALAMSAGTRAAAAASARLNRRALSVSNPEIAGRVIAQLGDGLPPNLPHGR